MADGGVTERMVMTDSPLFMFCVALIALCAVLTTLSMLITANSLWRTSQRLDLLLAHSDDAVREARQALGSVRTLFEFIEKGFKTARSFFGVNRVSRHVTNKRRVS